MTYVICKNTITEFVLSEVEKQIKFCIIKFDLGQDWKPLLKVTFAKNRIHSQAGRNSSKKPFVILALYRYLLPVSGFLEYEMYCKNTVIGSFISNNWKLCISALIAHELAHAVQFTLPVSKSSLRSDDENNIIYHELGTYSEGHGEFFQIIYRSLRKEFINKQVENNCLGIDPPANIVKKHPMAGTAFHHIELGKCVITDYFPKAKIYPYEYMDISGTVFQSTKARMASVALFDYY